MKISQLNTEKFRWLFAHQEFKRRKFRTLLRVLRWETHRLRSATLTLPFDGTDLTVHSSDGVGRVLHYFGTIDEDIFSLLDRYLQPGFTVVDVGANIGLYTVFAAKRIAPNGAVFAFEPNPAVFSRLQVNASAPNVRLLPIAVGRAPGRVDLALAEDTARSSVAAKGDSLRTVDVECISLDRFVSRDMDGGFVDYLKIDVEGFDYHVLLGATALLQEQAVGLLQLECSANRAEIYDLLTNYGYRVCRLHRARGMIAVESPEDMPFNVFALGPDLAPKWIARE